MHCFVKVGRRLSNSEVKVMCRPLLFYLLLWVTWPARNISIIYLAFNRVWSIGKKLEGSYFEGRSENKIRVDLATNHVYLDLSMKLWAYRESGAEALQAVAFSFKNL